MSNAFELYDSIMTRNSEANAVTQNLHERHYLWNPTEDIPHAEVVGGFIWRDQITPILTMPVWDNTADVPENLRTALRNAGSEARYLKAPYPIFRSVMTDYGAVGVTDLTAIKDWEPRQVLTLQIEKVFFPQGMAGTYDEIEKQIKEAKFPEENRDIYAAIGRDMLRGVQQARKYDTSFVDTTEGNIEKSKSHPGYSSNYTDPALRAMGRLGRERKDYAIAQVATRQNAIVEALPELIQGIAQQQGSALKGDDLMAFAKTLAASISEGVKEAVASAVKAAQPVNQQNNNQKR